LEKAYKHATDICALLNEPIGCFVREVTELFGEYALVLQFVQRASGDV